MRFIFQNFYIFLLAYVLAMLEIQIEGKDGWAKNLPTWRPSERSVVAKIYSKIMSGKELTGYHLAVMSFVLLILFYPLTQGVPVNLESISKTISLFFIFTILWDFLWFVFNRNYGVARFSGQYIWWHKKWFWKLPHDYVFAIFISLLIVLIPTIMQAQVQTLIWWIETLALFLFWTFLSIVIMIFRNHF